jgi:hypothetical protein
MNPSVIEVFVEPGCKSCCGVISLVTSYAQKRQVNLKIFDRERDAQVFTKRNVVVCPATYLNGRLLFYGEFTEDALNKHIRP